MKHIITLFFLVYSTVVFAQNEKILQRIGVSASASILDHTVRGQIEPFVTLGTEKKQILLAPTLLIASNIGYHSPQNPRLTGARIGYRYWPTSLDKKWSFYISADLRAQKLKDTWDSNQFDVQLAEYQLINTSTVELLVENYLGYGLEYNITKSISISQGIGLGWYLSNLNTTTQGSNKQVRDLVDYRGYHDIGFVWNVRFEISYVF